MDDTDGCPDKGESKVQVTRQKLVIQEKVYFDTNKDVVLERSFPLLQQVALVLKANPAEEGAHRGPHRQPGG